MKNRTSTHARKNLKNTILHLLLLAFVLLQFSSPLLWCEEEIADPIKASIESAVAKVKPSLVRILAVSTRYLQGRELKEESVGSGTIISKDGHIITNHHVAGHAIRLFCTLSNKEEIEAELVGTDALSDISVIRLKSDGKREFPFAQFGDSSKVKVGESVLAMGSPVAISQSVTLGIVSNMEMAYPKIFWPFDRLTLDGEDVGSIVLWIGHDAPIYGGNSGGPLVNLQGEIIGINEIKIGLGGAIPGNLAQDVAFKIINQGKVARSWLGMEFQPQLKYATQKKGVLVSSVLEDSPAAMAGFLSGDILLRLGGEGTDVRFAEEMPAFNQRIANLAVGKELDAVVLRNGKEVKLKVIPQEREAVQHKTQELKKWGITVRNISFLKAKELKRKNQDGVFVTSVQPGGPAGEAKPPLFQGDVIVEVDGKTIKNVSDLTALTEKLTEGKTEPASVTVGFERKNENYLTIVKLNLKPPEDPGTELQKAWLQVGTQVLTLDLAEGLGIPGATGVRITQIYPNSTAQKAGLKVGDILLSIDGKNIPASDFYDEAVFPAMIRQYPIGSTVKLSLFRGKKKLTLPVELEEAPKLDREMKKYKDDDFDFSVREIAFMDRIEQRWKEKQNGLIITEAKEGGWAALAQIRPDDLVVAVNGFRIADVPSFKQKMNEIKSQKPAAVVFQILRGVHTYYAEVIPKWKK